METVSRGNFNPAVQTRDLMFSLGNWPQEAVCFVNGSTSTSTKLTWTTSSGRRLPKSHLLSFSKKEKLSMMGGSQIRCSGQRVAVPSESEENSASLGSDFMDKETDPATQFKMSDFELCSHVSIGLAGRGDEVVFEAIVRNSESPLNNSRVVLRELAGSHAQRRGRRALEVLRKLARRQFMYRSYATRIHGYILPSSAGNQYPFTLVHGYYGSYSLHHWLLLSDWLPALEAKLALDEECARRVGDDTIGGPAVSRQLRLIRMLMRDLLIGVNYLHSHGLAHTELRLENVHISCVDRHIKVGILGNAADFNDSSLKETTLEGNLDRRKLMIAFDIRCVGFMMAKMVLRELMDPSIFMKFKSFLTMGNNPTSLREFLLPIIYEKSPSGSIGLQILDRNWGAGWNLLASMLATKPSDRISCLDALRHPFLCGPRWRVEPSIGIILWGLGSTAVRIAEEYIYGTHQRNRLAHLIDLMERLNPNPFLKNWLELLPGKWRLLYHTGRQIGLTFRQASPRVLIGHVYLNFLSTKDGKNSLSMEAGLNFTAMVDSHWPHDKRGKEGNLHIGSNIEMTSGKRIYESDSQLMDQGVSQEKRPEKNKSSLTTFQGPVTRKNSTSGKWRRVGQFLPKETPSSLPVVKLIASDVEVTMNLDYTGKDTSLPRKVLHEVRLQIPSEMFDITKLVCGTYIDSRLLVLRGVTGSALLFVRSFGS
eukprot:Gb_17934 [translate_table: standard]